MTCRFCGDEIHPLNGNLLSRRGSRCVANGGGFHVAVPDGRACIYCGYPAKNTNGYLTTVFGKSCRQSPSKAHCLA